MQGIQVQSLIQEDSTCWGAAKPVHHNYWTHALSQEKLPQWEARTLQPESSPHLPQLEKGQVNVKVKVIQSCLTLCDPMDYPRDSPGQNTGVGSLPLLQGIFPNQGSNPGLSHHRWSLYQLSHKGSPRILECVAYHSPADLPDPGIELPCRQILHQLSYERSPRERPHSATRTSTAKNK